MHEHSSRSRIGDALRWCPGAYPAVVRAAMAAFDIVEAIAVARTATCSSQAPLTRIQV
jgi:hypothetical protein